MLSPLSDLSEKPILNPMVSTFPKTGVDSFFHGPLIVILIFFH